MSGFLRVLWDGLIGAIDSAGNGVLDGWRYLFSWVA